MLRVHSVRPKGFTLIELLVVISIIALLVGILLPALGSARDRARSLLCLTNQGQIAKAQHFYAQDYDQYMTYTHLDNVADASLWGSHPGYDAGAYAGTYAQYWHYQLGEIMQPGLKARVDATADATVQVKMQTDGGLHCPSSNWNKLAGVLEDYDSDTTHWSYGMNRFVGAEMPDGSDHGAAHNNKATAHIDSVTKASHTFLTMDTFHQPTLREGTYLTGHFVWNTVARYRHAAGTVANLSFVDGHAESLKRSVVTDRFGSTWGGNLYAVGFGIDATYGAYFAPRMRMTAIDP